MPLLTVGNGDSGAWNWKYATAISPDRMKATGRVHRPSTIASPPNVSSSPPIPVCESSVNGGIGTGLGGQPNSLVVPADMNTRPLAMRTMDSTRPDHGERSNIDIARVLLLFDEPRGVFAAPGGSMLLFRRRVVRLRIDVALRGRPGAAALDFAGEDVETGVPGGYGCAGGGTLDHRGRPERRRHVRTDRTNARGARQTRRADRDSSREHRRHARVPQLHRRRGRRQPAGDLGDGGVGQQDQPRRVAVVAGGSRRNCKGETDHRRLRLAGRDRAAWRIWSQSGWPLTPGAYAPHGPHRPGTRSLHSRQS